MNFNMAIQALRQCAAFHGTKWQALVACPTVELAEQLHQETVAILGADLATDGPDQLELTNGAVIRFNKIDGIDEVNSQALASRECTHLITCGYLAEAPHYFIRDLLLHSAVLQADALRHDVLMPADLQK
jgi:hypothetical protein